MILVGVCVAGCRTGSPEAGKAGPSAGGSASPFDDPDVSVSSLGRPMIPAQTIRVVDIVFDVARIDFPLEGDRHSRKLWNHIDERRVDGPTAALWARNGMRVGVASPDAWPAIRAIVAASRAEVRRDPLVAQPGMPLAIELAAVGEDESIFAYDRGGRLVGKTFTEGNKLLNIEYMFHPELGRCTDLQIGFEIRNDRGVMTWERQAGTIQQVPSYDRHRFTDTITTITLHPDEVLIIGMGDAVENEYLLGGRLLTCSRAGRRFESVLCVTPRPYQAQSPKGRPS